MKAENLMIGDWVLRNGEPYQIRELGIYGVNRDGEDYPAVCVGKPKGIGLIIERNEIEPIPLTPEILEKNGFDVSDKEVMQYHFEEDGEKYHFSLRQMYDKDGKPHGYSFYAFNVLTLLDYVHELQHALRLCGIDKEIEL